MEYPHTITSSPYSFFEFQKDEARLIEILASKGIKYGANHRWAQLYKIWAEKSSEIETKKVTQVSRIETLNLLDLCEMNIIVEALPSIPDKILAAKWKLLTGGTINRFEETESNSSARNTQFELFAYADLRRAGISCSMGDPNPDILVNQDGVSINIQCKRVLNNSSNSVQRNVHNAVTQLRADYKDNGNLGVIALGVERIFSEGNSFLESETEETALEHVRQLHDKFYDSNKRYWSSKKVMGTTKVPMILLYTSTMAMLKSSSPRFAHVTEADRMGTIASDASRKQFRQLQKVLEKTVDAVRVDSHIHK